jgi:hypothetical protein
LVIHRRLAALINRFHGDAGGQPRAGRTSSRWAQDGASAPTMDSTVASNLLGVLFELGQPRIMKSTVTLQRIFAELQSKIGSLFDDRSDDQRIPHGLVREIDGTPVAAERRAHYRSLLL